MKRFKALDIFRGASVCLMIIVNTPGDWGSTFSPLLHAAWHGFTPTDLVFPSFLFAVGTSLAFVKRKWQDQPSARVVAKIARRSFIIFLLGYLMYWFPFMKWGEAGVLVPFPISETRIMGVLQRIALCYFIGSLMVYYLSLRSLIFWSVIFLLAYWAALYAWGDYTMKGNFGLTLDRWLLGGHHLYKGEGIPFDPEGVLGTLPAIVNLMGGYFAGLYLLRSSLSYEVLAKLLLAGIVLMILAYFWHLVFPVNKKLWTSSHVVLTIGLDLLILGLILYSTNFVEKPVNYYFFEVFGKNPLFIYLVSEYLAITLLFVRVDGEQSLYAYIYQNAFAWIGPYVASLAFALVFMFICWLVGYWLDRRKIYIRL